MNAEKSEIKKWESIVAEGDSFPGGVRLFCRERRIHSSRFYYWRSKLKKRESVNEKAFSRVKILPQVQVSHARLPDPKWLADFISALGGGR